MTADPKRAAEALAAQLLPVHPHLQQSAVTAFLAGHAHASAAHAAPARLEAQCWICPKCADDHAQDGPCSPPSGAFSPAPEDRSYIAQKYREQSAALRACRDALESVMRLNPDGLNYPKYARGYARAALQQLDALAPGEKTE